MAIATKKAAAIALAAGLAVSGSAGTMMAPAVFAQENAAESAAVSAAQVAPAPAAGANAATIDKSKKGSLTLKKRKNPTETGTATGETVSPEPGEGLDGVEFTLYKVKDVDITTNDGLAQAAQLTPAAAKERAAKLDAKKTANDGIISWNNLDLGVYLVEETQPVEGFSPAAPFLVYLPMTKSNSTEWNYDVVAYPKNYQQQEPTKTVEDSGLNVGQDLSYTINTFAQTLAKNQERTVYRIEDTLDTALDAANAKVTVNGIAEGGYTVQREGQKIIISINKDQLAAITNGQQISATITAPLKEKPANGTLVNEAYQIENFPNSSQENKKKTKEVKTYYGGIEFSKVNGGGEKLAGAEFQVYGASAGQDCDVAVNNQGALQAVAGKNTFTSAADGKVTIDGLHVNDIANSIEGNANKYVKYCLVESKAPAGYELLANPVEFTLVAGDAGKLGTVRVGENDGQVVNLPSTSTRLPSTGGMGVIVLAIAGLAIVGGGVYAARRNA